MYCKVECVCVKFKDTRLIQGAWNRSMEASHTDTEKIHGLYSVVLLCEIMFVPWLSKGLASRAGQRFDSAASVI